MKNSIVPFLVLIITCLNTGCVTEGCTDVKATNFSYEATKDNGSCDYGGCMDENALNYNPNALTDNGSCKYNGGLHFITTRNSVGTNGAYLSLEINSSYIGNLGQVCSILFPSCETSCTHLKFTDQTEGYYTLNYWEIKQTSSTIFDTIFTSLPISVKVVGGACNVVLIE